MRNEEQELTYRFADLDALKNAFMSFVRDGGIFIPTEKPFHLGDFINVHITLPESDHAFTFNGEVIWITPTSIQSAQHHQGVGIQCNNDEGEAFQRAVQQLFVGIKSDGDNPDTM